MRMILLICHVARPNRRKKETVLSQKKNSYYYLQRKADLQRTVACFHLNGAAIRALDTAGRLGTPA